MSYIFEIKNLCKHFGNIKAVNDISFTIEKGVCLGLLGPNGAGKSTTIELMEGIQKPTSGTILYQGEKLGDTFKNQAGIMFQHTALQDFVTVKEILTMFSRTYQSARNISDLIEECQISDFLNKNLKQLSGGQRQRVLLALSLINDPKFIFLDEPTTGLDPQSRRNLWHLVSKEKQKGNTILLTTHYMEEAYELCDRVLIIDHGVIIAEGSPDYLLKKHFNEVILELPKNAISGDLLKNMKALQGEQSVILRTQDVNATIKKLIDFKIDLSNLRVRSRNLEDLFLELTGKDLRQ